MGSLAPLESVDLGSPSPDLITYTQQLFAIEDGAEVNADSWPSEATVAEWRRQAIVQEVGSIVASGPHYHAVARLTNAQVIWAQNAYSDIAGTLNLNPVVAKALDRASRIAEKHPPEALLPWAHHGETQPIRVINVGHGFGSIAVSGYYGTGHGTLR